MKWLTPHWRLWLAIIAGWLLFGLTYTFNYYFYASHYVDIFKEPPTLGEMLIWELPYWLLWSMLSPLVFWLTQRFSLERGHLVRNSLIHIGTCLLLSLFHRAVYLPFDWVLGVLAYRNLGSLAKVYNENFFFNLPNGFLCYVIILLAGMYYRPSRQKERLEAELAQTKTQAQLQALKMQLQPHFLFNTLNSISARLGSDVEGAEEMLDRLGNFLRMMLDSGGAEEITLQDELEFLRCYLEIQRIRFPDRLSARIDVAPDTYDAVVPNLILQPIVENAIKHGVMGSVGTGNIEIIARRDGEVLRLEVKDDGPGLDVDVENSSAPKRGLGFALTRRRLECLYAAQQQFRLSDVPGGGLQVVVEIPFRVSTAAAQQTA